MTDDERELMLLNTTMLVALIREQYGQNIVTAVEVPELKKVLLEANEVLLEKSGQMLALQAKIKEPNLKIPQEVLQKYFSSELLKTIDKEPVKKSSLKPAKEIQTPS